MRGAAPLSRFEELLALDLPPRTMNRLSGYVVRLAELEAITAAIWTCRRCAVNSECVSKSREDLIFNQ